MKEVKSSEYFYLHDRRIGSKSSRVNEIVLNVSYHFLSGTYYKTLIANKHESRENTLRKTQNTPTL